LDFKKISLQVLPRVITLNKTYYQSNLHNKFAHKGNKMSENKEIKKRKTHVTDPPDYG
jgi:hypothetical protein